MCTVTFIPVKTTVFITHSRDEKSLRTPATPPGIYLQEGQQMLYPKDGAAGGSWIAIHENGNAAVLLNGGFTAHIPVYPYRKSRGLIFLEIAGNSDLYESFTAIDLHGIEPFTVILYHHRQLLECRWDGSRKHVKFMDASRPAIWSSATLYHEDTVAKRDQWFRQWLDVNPEPSQQDIIDFHLYGGEGDKNNDFQMNRNGILLTVSITGMMIGSRKGSMRYLDLQKEAEYNEEITFETTEQGSLSEVTKHYKE